MKHIYSTGVIYDCYFRSSKYVNNTGHRTSQDLILVVVSEFDDMNWFNKDFYNSNHSVGHCNYNWFVEHYKVALDCSAHIGWKLVRFALSRKTISWYKTLQLIPRMGTVRGSKWSIIGKLIKSGQLVLFKTKRF